MIICLERGADLHMAQPMPLPLTVSCSSKIQIDLPFWYRLTWVVPDKWPLNGPLNGCVCVCSSSNSCSSTDRQDINLLMLATHTHTRLMALCPGLPR